MGSGLAAAQSLPATQAAVERLARIQLFAMGGVGFAGQTSDGEKDFRLILQNHPQAAAVFNDLYVHGNNEAKAYALLGLYRLNPARFREIYATLPKSKDELQMMQGCILFKQKLVVVAKQINEGGFAK
jgi:hypothetical protein